MSEKIVTPKHTTNSAIPVANVEEARKIIRKQEDEQAERIKENLRDVNYDFSGMNYQQFQDLFEDRDPCEFL